jgi:predicted nucleotidyltransferase component of viral defense system
MKGKFKLTEEQRIIFDVLKKSPLKNRFYWTGGTALAYFYLQHRFSYDVDIFFDSPFGYQDILPLVRECARAD